MAKRKFEKLVQFVAKKTLCLSAFAARKKITKKQNGFIYLKSGYFLHYLQNKTRTTEINQFIIAKHIWHFQVYSEKKQCRIF